LGNNEPTFSPLPFFEIHSDRLAGVSLVQEHLERKTEACV
jgi:hypothetical protein